MWFGVSKNHPHDVARYFYYYFVENHKLQVSLKKLSLLCQIEHMNFIGALC